MKIKQLLIKFTPYLFPLIFLFLGAFLSFKNYTPGTWLSGWDTLHPEFDFVLNLKRTFFGVWREEQGVGALAAHSHMSEIPRIIILGLSSFLFPENFLRYFYFFLSLAVGPLGVYFFLKEAFNKKDEFVFSLASFLGGLYYLLNLGTLQHFYVPFEMFATQYGLLPWIFLLVMKYLKSGIKKEILLLFLLSFLAAPQAYASTLFYSYFAFLTLFLFFYILLEQGRKAAIKRGILILSAIFITNSFWILPNIYSLAKQSKVIESSRINILFSPEAFLRNKDWGTLPNIVTHKNFLFSWREYDEVKGEFVDLMDEWNIHLSSPYVNLIGFGLAAFVVLGFSISLIRKDKVGISLFVPMSFCLFFLINENPPTGFIYSFLRDNINAFKEAFRTPFTKVSILFIFSCSYYFATLFKEVFGILNRKKYLNLLNYIIASGVGISLIIYMFPAFGGFLISPSMRISIPDEYFQLSGYLKGKPDRGRIAKFPVNSLWGWVYYDWGYEGAGFNWFGIENPTLDRDFDRWSSGNETFYNEVSRAVYSKDRERLESVLEKFQVRYLLVDRSLVNPGGDQALTYTKEIQELLQGSARITKDKDFGFLSLYKTDFDLGKESVSAPVSYSLISSDLSYSSEDPLYEKHKTYVSGEGAVYPFTNFDERKSPEVTLNASTVTLTQKLDPGNLETTLILPDYPKTENSILVNVYLKKLDGGSYEVSFLNKTPEVWINGEKKAGGKFLWQVHPIRFVGGKPEYISIGSRVFSLTNLDFETNEKPLGVALLDTSETTLVNLFSGEKEEILNEVEKLQNTPGRWCSDPNKISQIDTNEGEYSLKVEKNSVCWGSGLHFAGERLLNISFEAKSLSGLYPRFCLSKAGKEGCVNSQTPYSFERGEWSKVSYLIPIESGDYFLDFVAQGQDEGKGEISFRNLTMGTFESIGKGAYSVGQNFALVSEEEKVEIAGETKEVSVIFPLYRVAEEEIGLGRGHSKAVNCDLRKVGEVSKENLGISLRYRAQEGGVSCDYLDYLELPTSQGYIFRIQGNNSLGRSLKVYLENRQSRRMDLEELLPEGTFDEEYFVLPNKSKGEGYVLNFETRSFGNVASENSLSGVEFIHLPFSWLSNLSLGGVKKVGNNLSIVGVRKIGNSYYKVKTEGKGLLILGQGFEDGWVAVSGMRVLKHERVDSWANGWRVDEGGEVSIYYWPQLLELSGFGILLGGLFFLIISKENRVDNDPTEEVQ